MVTPAASSYLIIYILLTSKKCFYFVEIRQETSQKKPSCVGVHCKMEEDESVTGSSSYNHKARDFETQALTKTTVNGIQAM